MQKHDIQYSPVHFVIPLQNKQSACSDTYCSLAIDESHLKMKAPISVSQLKPSFGNKWFVNG